MSLSSCFGIITYLVSNAVFANYLQLHFVRGSGEVAVLCGALHLQWASAGAVAAWMTGFFTLLALRVYGERLMPRGEATPHHRRVQ